MAQTRPGNGKIGRIVFEYKNDPDYREIPVNGAWGGHTARNEIHMQLFHEHPTPPATVSHQLEGNKLGREIRGATGVSTYTRQVFVGVVMSPANAKSIATWLLDKVKEVDGLTQETSDVLKQ